MMSKGNVNGALELLTENMSNGILPLNDKTLKMLKQKHSEANEPPQEVLLQGRTWPGHPIVYEDMDQSLILKAAMLTKGGSGPSGLDADGCRKNPNITFIWNSIIRLAQDICTICEKRDKKMQNPWSHSLHAGWSHQINGQDSHQLE